MARHSLHDLEICLRLFAGRFQNRPGNRPEGKKNPECSTMFYTKPTVEFAERIHKLREALKAAALLPQDQRGVKIAELRHYLHDPRPHGICQAYGWTGPSCTPRRRKLFGSMLRAPTPPLRLTSSRDGARMASSKLMEEYQIKLDRYALLAAIAEKQFLDGWRPVAPLVLPVVLTTHCEYCPGATELHEWLVERYRLRLLLEGPREDRW
jgi:hypothetical protein